MSFEMISTLVMSIVGLLALLLSFLAGQKASAKRSAREYRRSRIEIDEIDIGVGSTDNERIKRLHEIASGK